MHVADSTVNCIGAVTLTAAGSNVRVQVNQLSATGGATLSCSPAATSALTLDPTAATAGGHTIVCDITSPTLTQQHYEDGRLTFGVTATGVVANGYNTTMNADQEVSFNKTLTQTRKYRLGVKRVAYDVGDTMPPVTTAGEKAEHWLCSSGF